MNVLKFRLWSTVDKDHTVFEMIYHKDIAFRNAIEMHNNGESILMQYIGLKDKNGKEIYEYDILKFCHKDGGEWFGFGYCFYDIDETCFCHTYHEVFDNKIEYDSQRPSKRFWANSNITCEILGNKYENPELLKGE